MIGLLKTTLGFIGFTDIRTVVAEPPLGAPAVATRRCDDAVAQTARMGAAF